MTTWLKGLGIALVMASLTACHKKGGGAGKPQAKGGGQAVPVLAVKAVEKSMAVQVRAIGNVQSSSKVSIRSRVSGQLKFVGFQEGQEVKKGDLLFKIDPRTLESALRAAQANLARDEVQQKNAQ